jgi:dTDP-4-amino-4,6-dideoxygalactose transaminase
MKEKIKFSLPLIDQDVINEMNDTLINTGWLTSGPKVQKLEEEIKNYLNSGPVVCVNSWTSGAMLMLRWFGVGPGDEVIIPAYTYSATALAVLNMGAKPVMVDVGEDFNIDTEKTAEAINENTKVIMPVDIGGWPCDYDKIFQLVKRTDIIKKFTPSSQRQKLLGRILVLADAAHSFGAFYNGIAVGRVADITVFSLHSAKNITTGEGGAVCLNLHDPFDNLVEYKFLKALSLNGQTKSAFERNQPDSTSWKYDIIDQGLKVNMPDICAAVGLAQLFKYKEILLPDRKHIFDFYDRELSRYEWAIIPKYQSKNTFSSFHLFLLRIKNINEKQRDLMIQSISDEGVGVNVHYIPMAMLTLFKNLGYDINNYPNTYKLYCNLITLPVYNGLKDEQLQRVVDSVINAYNKIK